MDPLISIVYVNYNTSQLLINSIRSVQERCMTPYELIIVDNNSDLSQKSILTDWIKENPLANLKVILSDTNSGFAAANNSGAELATGKYLFFLNPDTVVLNDVLQIFYSYMEGAGDTIAACGGNLLHEDLSPNSSYGNFPGILLECCNVGLGLSFLLGKYFKDHVDIGSKLSTYAIRKVDYIVGADVFLRSDVFREFRGFDTGFFMYYEETDLFLRFKKRNLESYILPQARIIHYEGASLAKDQKGFNYKKFELLLNSKLYYYRKWFPRSMPIIKTLILMQICVQYFKGRWGSDLGELISIYRRSMAYSHKMPGI